MAELWWRRERARTLVLVNLASIMEMADEALLPGVYKEIAEALHTSLPALGSLTLLRSITQAFCFPLAAYFCLHYDRARVIAAGAFLWAIATICVGASSTFAQIALSRALNGIGLALVIPAIQSLVADSSSDSNRGLAFGFLQLTTCIGTILGGGFSVLLAGTTFMGISGWRLSFFIVTIISVVLGILLLNFAVDPRQTKQQLKPASFIEGLRDAFSDGKHVLGIRTFQILVAQGIVGNIPGATMAFAPLWLELKGFSHPQTAVLLGLWPASGAVGGLLGGFLGDVLSIRLPNSGRIMLAQFSSGTGIPLTALLLLGLPYKSNTSSAVLHGLTLTALGLLNSWNAPATNNPIFAEIVPEKSRTTIYALDRSFETVLSSFAPPMVGLLAEKVYGYKPPSHVNRDDANEDDARSLGKALYAAYAIPMTLCALTYSFLYCTYAEDRENARIMQQSEMLQLAEDEAGSLEVVTIESQKCVEEEKLLDKSEH